MLLIIFQANDGLGVGDGSGGENQNPVSLPASLNVICPEKQG